MNQITNFLSIVSICNIKGRTVYPETFSRVFQAGRKEENEEGREKEAARREGREDES